MTRWKILRCMVYALQHAEYAGDDEAALAIEGLLDTLGEWRSDKAGLDKRGADAMRELEESS